MKRTAEDPQHIGTGRSGAVRLAALLHRRKQFKETMSAALADLPLEMRTLAARMVTGGDGIRHRIKLLESPKVSSST